MKWYPLKLAAGREYAFAQRAIRARDPCGNRRSFREKGCAPNGKIAET
ncbi:MAG: hypothetical protein F6K32_02400 [Desertifilum sp. SIO1I2]|nr:hypothetical protein [Desertifilum sp. SIO1I2]